MSYERTILEGHLTRARAAAAALEAEIAGHSFGIRQRLDKHTPMKLWPVTEVKRSMDLLAQAHAELLTAYARIEELERDLG